MIDNPTLTAIRERRSVRSFTSEPVTDQQVEAILEAGRWAPSGLNSQPWAFVVAREPQIRAAMGDILRRITYSWKGFATAPVLIVVSVDSSRDPGHFVEDGAVAAHNLCLAAQSLGLASSWAGIYAKRARRGSVQYALKALLSLPRPHRIIAVIPIGVARHETKTSRRPLAEMVHHDRFHPLPDSRPQARQTPSSDPGEGTRELPRMRRLRAPAESGKLV
ncbi:nitroreductase family protein [bacterium]|nr:nitroreductase family protein [bacterium]